MHARMTESLRAPQANELKQERDFMRGKEGRSSKKTESEKILFLILLFEREFRPKL